MRTIGVLAVLVGASAHATVPLPVYPACGEPDRPDLCPSDLGDDWELSSTIPAHARDSIRPAELELGSGLAADRAWRVTTGDWDVMLAIGDSGVDWSSRNTARKHWLNADELPFPQGSDGSDAGVYDRNGDGVFNITDWADDPRVDPTAGVDAADGLLDPSDLIATFSDGVDDDGNGYPDDICGWDFFDDDNDPHASLPGEYGQHGQGVASGAAAEGGDGGDIGVCPSCSILPVRVGDTFITDGDRVARAIAYAADQGASGISLAVGAFGTSEATAAAARYAWDHGLVLSAVAGDENGFHHNAPALLPEALYLRSVRYDTPSDSGPVYSYFNTQNCNNFGARMDLVAPSRVCATGAATVTLGVVGLIQSAALAETGARLHTGEVVQLLVQQSEDVWLTEAERERSGAYPSAQGWDPYTGYGRVDAEKAVNAVVRGDIPPWVLIDGPRWFLEVDPASGDLAVTGTISAERAGGVSYTVWVGTGHDPRDWQPVGQGEGAGRIEGELARLDLSALDWRPVAEAERSESLLERMERVNENAVTVRVDVEDDRGLRATARRTIFLDDDPDRVPGFPVTLPASAEASPVLADLDGDGVFEVIVATGGGQVFAFDGAGEVLAGWPVDTEARWPVPLDAAAWGSGAVPEARDAILSTPAVGDLDGDGSPEVVAAGISGFIGAWHADGTVVQGFPRWTLGRDRETFGGSLYNLDQGVAASVVLADLDDDGSLEVIVAGFDGRLYVIDHTGADVAPYPVDVCDPPLCGEEGYRILASPAVGDLDGDGDLDFVLGTNETPEGLYFVEHALDARTATALPGWPLRGSGVISYSIVLPMIGEGHPSSVSLADLDGDGDLEIADPILLGQPLVRDHTGVVLSTARGGADDFGPGTNIDRLRAPGLLGFAGNAAWGDLDGDGVPDLALGAAGVQYFLSLAAHEYVDYQQPVGAWSGAGALTGEPNLVMLEGFPRQVEDIQLLSAPAIADVTGDDAAEVIAGSAGYLLHAWDASGAEAPGWPKHTGGWILGGPAVGDIDGDGWLDVVATTREGQVFAWTTAGRADQDVAWAGFRHDAQNTGNLETPLPAQLGPADPLTQPTLPTERGCCKGDRGVAGLLALPMLLAGVRRRRR